MMKRVSRPMDLKTFQRASASSGQLLIICCLKILKSRGKLQKEGIVFAVCVIN